MQKAEDNLRQLTLTIEMENPIYWNPSSVIDGCYYLIVFVVDFWSVSSHYYSTTSPLYLGKAAWMTAWDSPQQLMWKD